MTPVAVPGVQAHLAAYRAVARLPHIGKGRGVPGLESPLVGRGAELQALQQAVGDVRAGLGGLATIVGEAGIGKSRLVAEARARLLEPEGGEIEWAEGRCLSYASGIPFLLWQDLLRDVLGVPSGASHADVAGALHRRVHALFGECLGDVHPYLARLMSLPLERDYEGISAMRGESLRAEVSRALQRFLEAVARERPLVVVCEDLHWADSASLELLERLLPLTDRTPLLIICVQRPAQEHGSWRLRETVARLYAHRHTDLPLYALSIRQSEMLVGNLLRVEDLPGALRAQILEYAEGNPFFVEEIIRSLRDGGTIALDEASGRWQAAGPAAHATIPATLQSVLLARIDSLPATAKRVLQIASVIGRIVPYDVLAAVADEPTLDGALVVLMRRQMIRERSRFPELTYIFKHELTRRAAHEGLLTRDRRSFHRRVAETLERLSPELAEEQPGLLAHHWGEAGQPQQAVPYLLRAGDHAYTTYANDEAAGYFRRALASLDSWAGPASTHTWRLAALTGLGKVNFGIGQLAEAEQCFRDAIALGTTIALDPRGMVHLLHWLAEVAYWQSQPGERIRLGKEGLRILGDDTQSLEAVLMNQAIAVGLGSLGEREEAYGFTSRTASFIRNLPYSEELAPAFEHIAEMTMERDRDTDEARGWLSALERRASAHQHVKALGTVKRLLGRLLAATGDLLNAIAAHEQALQLYSRTEDKKAINWSYGDLADAYLLLGELEKAQAYAQDALLLARSIDSKDQLAVHYWRQGVISMCCGAWHDACGTFARVADTRAELGQTLWSRWAGFMRARARLLQGDREAGQRELRSFVGLMRAGDLRDPLAVVLDALEAAFADEDFRVLCRQLSDDLPEQRRPVGPTVPSARELSQWHFAPAQPCEVGALVLHDDFSGPLTPEWIWADPFGDCTLELEDGLTIRAANGRGLGGVNWSAPRLLLTVDGDFAAQVTCMPAPRDQLQVRAAAVGGLLLATEDRDGVVVGYGWAGEGTVAFGGSLAGEAGREGIIGRGRFPPPCPEELSLRLERAGGRIRALCSVDGRQWFTVGQIAAPLPTTVQVGLCAIGNIDRLLNPGPFPEGAAMSFTSFDLWQA